MAEGSLIFKPNLQQLSWGGETAFAEAAVESAQTEPFGILNEEVKLPDPDIDWQLYRNIGYGADPHIAVAGKREMTGSIPMLIQNGKLLKYALGACSDTGSVGDYTHAITGAETLPSLCLEAIWNNGTADFIRYYRGCKIGGCALSAEEEGPLKCTLDVQAARAETTTQAKSTVTLLTTKPYMFDQGTCTFWGSEFARVASWSMNIKRALKPRYYIQDTNGEFPYEINEGVRDVDLTATIVAADDIGSGTDATDAMTELLSPTAAGFDISLLFTRGANDTITISNPAAKKCVLKSAPHPLYGPGAEDSPIVISVLMKGVEISVNDAIATY
jgi:hypothetical protein